MTSRGRKFDEMDIDMDLAQKYLQKYNMEFHCISDNKQTEECVCDAANNKIYCSTYSNTLELSKSDKTRDFDTQQKFFELAIRIEKQGGLFCQLEYLIRQKPIETTELELRMIVSHLKYQGTILRNNLRSGRPLVMKNDTPLIELGCLGFDPGRAILAAENTAVVCHLFVKLCRAVGFDSVTLTFLKNKDMLLADIPTNKAVEGGCIGVVTAQSDVESAVPVFLSAPKGELWGIRRILVQENTVKRFKTEFEWRTRSSETEVDPELKSRCRDVYVHKDQTYVRETTYVQDYAGEASPPDVVLIESFRTVKELLSLLDSYRPFCVSLWSGAATESNTIAYDIKAPIVWVNGYGTIGAPMAVSLAYYSRTISSDYNDSCVQEVQMLQKSWAKLAVSERKKRVLNLVGKLRNNDVIAVYRHRIQSYDIQSANFVHVGRNYVTVGVRKSRDVYAIEWEANDVGEVMDRLCEGSGFMIRFPDGVDDGFRDVFKEAAIDGIPVRLMDFTFLPDCFPLPDDTRVIHSKFTTLFAN